MNANDSALIVECFGRRAIVQLENGARLAAAVFGKRTEVVCGDRVRIARTDNSDELQIVEVLPRTSLITRTDSRGRVEALAANVSLLAVVCAPQPQPDLFIVDRYLAGAGYAGVDTLVILNKSDLLEEGQDLLSDYRAAGYATLTLSATSQVGIDSLRERVRDQTVMLVGQSGVGKSTISNALVPEGQRATRALSDANREGRHTTVSSALFPLPGGGALIDSPGVRDYAPPPLADIRVQNGWREILALAPQCKFNNCMHLREPGCAVTRALAAGEFSERRYESYKRLLNLMRDLAPSHERY